MRKKRQLQAFLRTDAGNAEMFAALYAGKVLFDHTRGRWLIWDDKRCRWNEDRQNKVRVLMKKTARRRYRAALRISGEEDRRKESGWALGSESQYRIDAALQLAKSEAPISDDGEGWDADPWLFGVANGIVDLRTGKLRAATQQDRITKFSPVTCDENARCPRFEQFLNEIFGGDSDLIAYIQRAVGYTLTGSVREQCIFLLYGTGANGKTTLLEILLYVIGDYGVDFPISALEAKRNGNAPGEAVNLPGARFVKSVEIREGRRLDEARVKALTGGDTISVRPLYRNAFSFNPTHKLWLAVNHKPVISDNSAAMWRRIRLIPFLCMFEGQQADKGLLEALKAEASGTLNWMIQGCLAWQKEGLEPPPSVQEASREYERESDLLERFLDDCCIINPAESVLSRELWNAYLCWCKQNDERFLSRSAFADRLKRRGFTSEESGHEKRRVWRGLALGLEWRTAEPRDGSGASEAPQDEASAGARVGAGEDSQNFSNHLPIREVSVDGHPLTPADPQPLGTDAKL